MVSAMELYMLLPKKTGCKECGCATCLAFAVGLINGEKKLKDCPPAAEPKRQKNLAKLEELTAKFGQSAKTGLIIHGEKCTGCGNCVVACPVNVACEPTRCAVGLGPQGDRAPLAVIDGKAALQNAEECRRFGQNSVLCNVCEQVCPGRAIEFV